MHVPSDADSEDRVAIFSACKGWQVTKCANGSRQRGLMSALMRRTASSSDGGHIIIASLPDKRPSVYRFPVRKRSDVTTSLSDSGLMLLLLCQTKA